MTHKTTTITTVPESENTGGQISSVVVSTELSGTENLQVSTVASGEF